MKILCYVKKMFKDNRLKTDPKPTKLILLHSDCTTELLLISRNLCLKHSFKQNPTCLKPVSNPCGENGKRNFDFHQTRQLS